MARNPDILVIGGGIAGLSAAAALAANARVTVIEAEEQIGFHASGRSATMLHYALGDRLVRALTLASRRFFDRPPATFGDQPLGRRMPVLVFARDDERPQLDELDAAISPFAKMERLESAAVHRLCPLLNDQQTHGIVDRTALRLDAHALLQGNLRQFRSRAGVIATGRPIAVIERRDDAWHIATEGGERWSAPILVNAAGAWSDEIARMAGVQPVGLQPKRRTIVTFDAPPGTALEQLPFAKTVGDGLYFAPESGRLFASPMDEVPSEACDAQAEEYEVALAAFRMEERTTVKVDQVHSRWAGLRSFTPDGHPVVGFAPDADGFFWLAGQGGFGLQTSPAMASIAISLISGSEWPVTSVSRESVSPGRFAARAG